MAIGALVSPWILVVRGDNIVTAYEQTVFLSNRILCRFNIRVIVQTEKDGTWIISQHGNESRYYIDFLLGVTYVDPNLIADELKHPRLKICFHSPSSGQSLLEEHIQANSSWFDTEFENTPSQLTLSVRVPLKWKGLVEASGVRLEPNFRYDIYHCNSSHEEHHIFSANWYGEPAYIDVTQTSGILPSSSTQNSIVESVITAALTVVIGVTVYSLSQVFSKFLIEPIHKLDEIRGKIADSLIFYANIYANPGVGPEYDKASDQFRQLASLLMSRTQLVRMYGFFSRLRMTPKMSDISKAHQKLIGLSNRIYRTEYATMNVEEADEIRKLLKM